MNARWGWSVASALVVAAALMTLGPMSFGWDDPPEVGPSDVELINPNGKWPKFEIGKTRGVHLFHDTKGWRILMTKPGGRNALRIQGTITPVLDGRIDDLAS